MQEGKKGKVLRVPNEEMLNKLGISKASASALTRKMAGPLEISNEIEVHHSVLKMQNSMFSARSKRQSGDPRFDKMVEQLKTVNSSADDKLKILEENKKKHQNTRKLEYEVELEKKRQNTRHLSKLSLSKTHELDENKRAQMLYSNATSDLNGVKIKQAAKPKVQEEPKTELAQMYGGDIKQLRIAMTQSKPTVKSEKIAKTGVFTSPSDQYFAMQLGWIEDTRRFRMSSPLNEYKTEQTPPIEAVSSTEEAPKTVTPVAILPEKPVESAPDDTPREMDMAEIQRLERKYQKEAEQIRRQMARSEEKSRNHVENISTVYSKLLGDSPVLKIVNEKKVKRHNADDYSSSDIDVSKIPSFVLNEQEKKTSKK